jgi:hypothetical protein
MARVMTSGMVKNNRDWVTRSQVLNRHAVHRLNVGRCSFEREHLRYSRTSSEKKLSLYYCSLKTMKMKGWYTIPFGDIVVHTARRSYRLNGSVKSPDSGIRLLGATLTAMSLEADLTSLFRGRRSRNKVSVGEPAEGSLT